MILSCISLNWNKKYASIKNVWILICRTYVSKLLRFLTFFPYLSYFVQNIEFFILNSIFFKWKKILILSKNVWIQIFKFYLSKLLRILPFFHISNNLVKKTNFLFSKVFSQNQNKMYWSYRKMCEFKFVELFEAN